MHRHDGAGDDARSSDQSAEVRAVYVDAVRMVMQHRGSSAEAGGEGAGDGGGGLQAAALAVGAALRPRLRQDAVPPVLKAVLGLPHPSPEGRVPGARLVGLIGIPGAGKSTTADLLAQVLGFACLGVEEARDLMEGAAGDWRPAALPVLGMDGFHIPLARLRAEQGARGVYWRGAPETFDRELLAAKLSEIRGFLQGSFEESEPSVQDFSWPSFDHAEGDPRPDTMSIRSQKCVLVEGNYLLLWPEVANLLDVVVLLDNLSVDDAVARLKVRNACIPGYTLEEIEKRCDEVDRQNAEVVVDSMKAFSPREGQTLVRLSMELGGSEPGQ